MLKSSSIIVLSFPLNIFSIFVISVSVGLNCEFLWVIILLLLSNKKAYDPSPNSILEINSTTKSILISDAITPALPSSVLNDLDVVITIFPVSASTYGSETYTAFVPSAPMYHSLDVGS